MKKTGILKKGLAALALSAGLFAIWSPIKAYAYEGAVSSEDELKKAFEEGGDIRLESDINAESELHLEKNAYD